MSKKEKILTVVIVAVLLIAIAAGLLLTNPKWKQAVFGGEAPATGMTFTVTVVHSNGESKEFTYTTQEIYVGTALQKEGLIEGPIEEYGMYIQVVDGETAIYEENQAYWAFYVNGEYAMQGIDLTPIEENTAYSLVYTAE